MSGELVHTFNAVDIEQRPDDGYMDATAMCQANGKKWSHYWANSSTQEFVLALAESTGIPADSLVQAQSGRGGGTYVHPKLAMHLAQWCSPKFAVLVSGWVFELLTTGKARLAPTINLGPYTDRALAGIHVDMALPAGHWCVFTEASQLLIAAEQIFKPAGLSMDADDLLDGSVGTFWSRFRRGQPWASPAPRYEYVFPPPSRRQGVTVTPYAYPLAELGHFRSWMRMTYIPVHFRRYVVNKYGLTGFALAAPHIKTVLPAALGA